jgi:GDPmannose 4,6-dehydratase
MKKALITGITGQDGAYLTELLLDKGYEVHGLRRRSSLFNTNRIDKFINDKKINNSRLFLHYGDLSDSLSLVSLINKHDFDEVYNLGAQSHVGISFDQPEYTSNIDGLGVVRLLEAIKNSKNKENTKFYQASTSELYGGIYKDKQNEKTPFYPRSPYAVAKLMAYWATINYREAHGMFAVNGILFNHESPLRGENFVTRKITRGLTRVHQGLQDRLILGNIDAKRDWGHAKEYVELMWLSLQYETPNDYVAASGKQYSIREFIILCLQQLGINLAWSGKGIDEYGFVESFMNEDFQSKSKIRVGDKIIGISEEYFRPSEVDSLLGDSSFARETLGWECKIGIDELASEMMQSDGELARQEFLIQSSK